MATVGPTQVVDCTFGGTFRLGGDFSPGTVFSTGNIYRARLHTGANIGALTVRVKVTLTSTGPVQVQIKPQTANIRPQQLTVSDVTTSLTAVTTAATSVEAIHSYTTKGEQVFDVVLDASASSAVGSILYVDVFATRV